MPERVARFLVLSASNRLINGDWVGGRWQNTGIGGTTHGGEEFCTPAAEVCERVEALSGLPFSKQKREWLTLSHPPAWTPEQQIDLFA